MTKRLLLTCAGCLLLSARLVAAEAEPAQPATTNMKEVLRARMAEDAAKKAPAPKARPATSSAASATPTPAPAAADTPAAANAEMAPIPVPANPATGKDGTTKKAPETATVMPKVEVKKGRITVLDQQLAKQDEDIARERKNLKPTETDLALNDAKIATPLAIFGGESSQYRQRVATERVSLMEAEKDLLEAIARAKTKPEKQELQKQLDELRAMRRDLDKSLR